MPSTMASNRPPPLPTKPDNHSGSPFLSSHQFSGPFHDFIGPFHDFMSFLRIFHDLFYAIFLCMQPEIWRVREASD